MSGGLWNTGDVLTKDRLNRKTITMLTGNEIASLSPTYAGQFVFCTQSGSGFVEGYFYIRNSTNTAWLPGWRVPTKKVIITPQAGDYFTPIVYNASSDNNGILIDSQTSSTGNYGRIYASNSEGQKFLYVSGTPWYQQCIAKIEVQFRKVGSPTGTLYAKVLRVSDYSVIATALETVNVANIPTTWTTYTFHFSPPVYMGEAILFAFEYNGGDTNNCVQNNISYGDYKANTNRMYGLGTSWYDAVQDFVYWLYKISFDNAVDDNLTTYWESVNETNPWIIIDAGALKLISGVRIYWLTNGRPTNLKIDVSEDASTWETVYTTNTQPPANAWTEYPFPTCYCRYIKIQAIETLAMRIAEIDYCSKISDRIIAEHGHGE
ncbi:MAG: discoidin domain-containing protein [Nitrososphaerales archaeon]